MTDNELIKRDLPPLPEFEKWLRSVCFQAPPAHAYNLARCAWIESGRTTIAQAQSCVPAGWVFQAVEALKSARLVGRFGSEGGAAVLDENNAALAASPQPQPVQPMTQDEIDGAFMSQKLNGTPFQNGVRAAERHHGIAAPQPKD